MRRKCGFAGEKRWKGRKPKKDKLHGKRSPVAAGTFFKNINSAGGAERT